MHIGTTHFHLAQPATSSFEPSANSAGHAAGAGVRVGDELDRLTAAIKSNGDPSEAVHQLMNLCELPGRKGTRAQEILVRTYGSKSTSEQTRNEIGRAALDRFAPSGALPLAILFLAHRHACMQTEPPAHAIEQIGLHCERRLPEELTNAKLITRLMAIDARPTLPEILQNVDRLQRTLAISGSRLKTNGADLINRLSNFFVYQNVHTEGKPKVIFAYEGDEVGYATLIAYDNPQRQRCAFIATVAPPVIGSAQAGEPQREALLSACARQIFGRDKVHTWQCDLKGLKPSALGSLGCVLLTYLDQSRRSRPEADVGGMLLGFANSWGKRTPEQQHASIAATRCAMLMHHANTATVTSPVSADSNEGPASPTGNGGAAEMQCVGEEYLVRDDEQLFLQVDGALSGQPLEPIDEGDEEEEVPPLVHYTIHLPIRDSKTTG